MNNKTEPDVRSKAILRFVYIMGQQIIKFSSSFKTGSLDVTKAKEKQLLHVSLI